MERDIVNKTTQVTPCLWWTIYFNISSTKWFRWTCDLGIEYAILAQGWAMLLRIYN